MHKQGTINTSRLKYFYVHNITLDQVFVVFAGEKDRSLTRNFANIKYLSLPSNIQKINTMLAAINIVESEVLTATCLQVNATDKDEGENAEISYSIYHVSNNGGHKFKIDPALGVIETTGKLSAGEQYSITVQVR